MFYNRYFGGQWAVLAVILNSDAVFKHYGQYENPPFILQDLQQKHLTNYQSNTFFKTKTVKKNVFPIILPICEAPKEFQAKINIFQTSKIW